MFTLQVQLQAACLMHRLVLKHLTQCRERKSHDVGADSNCSGGTSLAGVDINVSFAFPSAIRFSCASFPCCSFIKRWL